MLFPREATKSSRVSDLSRENQLEVPFPRALPTIAAIDTIYDLRTGNGTLRYALNRPGQQPILLPFLIQR